MKHIFILVLALCLHFQAIAQTSGQELLEAIKLRDIKKLKALVQQGANVDACDENGATALMWASYTNNLEMLKLLVNSGANVHKKGVIYLDDEKEAYYGNLLGIAAGVQNLEMLKYFIETCKIDVNDAECNPKDKSQAGWTALQWACSPRKDKQASSDDYFSDQLVSKAQENSETDIASYLIEKGANLNVSNGPGAYTPLLLALYNQKWELADLLIQKGAVVAAISSTGVSALHLAALHGRYSNIIDLIRKGANPSVHDQDGNTPLMYCANGAQASPKEMVTSMRILHTMGCDVAFKNKQGQTALDLAKINADNSVVQYLENPIYDYLVLGLFKRENEILEYIKSPGFKPNQKYIQDYSLMDYAAIKNKPEWIKILESKGEDINSSGFNGQTPLMNAAEHDSYKAAEALLQLKANINYQVEGQEEDNLNGWSALHVAAKKGNVKIIKLLAENGANLNARTKHGSSPAIVAALFNQLEAVKLLFRLKADLTLKDSNNRTALEAAKAENSEQVVGFLSNPSITWFDELFFGYTNDVIAGLERGQVNVNEQNKTGQTLLHYAATLGYEDVVKNLLNKKADVNIPDQDGNIAINLSIFKGNSNITKLLAENSNLNHSNKNGWFPLHFASKQSYALTRLLLQKGAKPDVQEKNGHTPLMIAAVNENVFIVRLLHIYGANQSTKDNKGKMAIDWSTDSLVSEFLKKPYRCPFILANCGFDAEVIKMLKSNKELINKKDVDNWSIRDNAISGNAVKLLQYLIDNKVDMYDYTLKWNDYDLTPLQFAIVRNHTQAACLLIKNGIKTEISDSIDSDLRLSLMFDSDDVAKFILQNRKINLNLKNSNGWTHLFHAAASNRFEMAKLLIDKGADTKLVDNDGNTPAAVARSKGYTRLAKYLEQFL
jgi:ankyrin repeat domain-containing protein 50